MSPITDVSTQQVVESNALTSSLGKLNAGSKSMTRAFKLKAGYMELMGSIPRSESTKQLGEPPSESTKPAPTPSVPGGPDEENVELENPFGRSLITLKMVAPQKELNVEAPQPDHSAARHKPHSKA